MSEKLFDPYNPMDSTMFYLAMYHQKANIPLLKDAVFDLIRMMTQKSGGQEDNSAKRKGHLNVSEELDMTIKTIVIEAMCLVLSGNLENIEETNQDNDCLKVQND